MRPSSTARVDELDGPSYSDVRLDHRARACVGGRSKGGQEGQAPGRSRGGFTTKIHAKSDASGDIIAFDLTGGEAFDGRHFEILLDIGPDIQPRAVICDKGYASKANRDAARKRGVAPVIPHKANEKNKPAFFARTLYKARARIEQGVRRLKRFERVALRCEKWSDPVWWTPLKLIFEVSDAPLPNRLSAGVPATDGRSGAIWTHARRVGA